MLTKATETWNKPISRNLNIFAVPSLLKIQLEIEYKSFQYSTVKYKTGTDDSPQVQV